MALTVLRSIRPSVTSGDASQSVSPIVMEAVLSEAHAATSEITSRPVEDGFDISDGVHYSGLGLQLSIGFSNNPLKPVENDGVFAGSSDTRVAAAWDAFLNLMKSKEPLLVGTGLKQYDNMHISDIGTVQDVNNATNITIQVSMKQVRRATAATTRVTARELQAGEVRQRASPTVEGGDQAAVDVGDFGRACPNLGEGEYEYVDNPDYDSSKEVSDENKQYILNVKLLSSLEDPRNKAILDQTCLGKTGDSVSGVPPSLFLGDAGITGAGIESIGQ